MGRHYQYRSPKSFRTRAEIRRMRSRIVIGVIAALVIGVGVYVLSEPKEGTVEWHKREYLRASKTLHRRTLAGRIRAFYDHMRKTSPVESAAERAAEQRLRSSQRHLIELGYLAQQRFVLDNQPALQVLDNFIKTPFGQRQKWEWVDVQVDMEAGDTNVMVLTARPHIVEAFGHHLRTIEADASAGKN